MLAESPLPIPLQHDRFDSLFAQHYAELYALIYRVLGERMATEDILQDAFLKLAHDPRIQQQPDGEVGAWLRRVAMNLAFNRVRGERRAQARLERVGRLELPEDDRTSDAPASVLLRLEDQQEVRRALAELPERQRECLLLRHSGYAYAEIAATLGIAVGSVGVLLARAEQTFRATYRRQSQP
jgi:RNA polymerase sigma-70 factor (ECF subfamily)